MEKDSMKNIAFISAFIVMAAMSRIIPHPGNFAPLGAMALFGASYFKKSSHALLVTLGSWWLSDLVLNNTVYKAFFPSFTWISNSFITVAVALVTIHFVAKRYLKNSQPVQIVIMSLVASLLFFAITNFGSFLDLYPRSVNGLVAAYTAGLPFLKYTILGDLFYSAVLFGMYQFISARVKVFNTGL